MFLFSFDGRSASKKHRASRHTSNIEIEAGDGDRQVLPKV